MPAILPAVLQILAHFAECAGRHANYRLESVGKMALIDETGLICHFG